MIHLGILVVLGIGAPFGSPSSQSAAAPVAAALDSPNPQIQQQVDQYLQRIVAKGFDPSRQSVWMQTQDQLLANVQGTVPLPAASVTKVATTLAALETFGPDHRFVTLFGSTGSIRNGTLQGDLVVQGAEDPLFVWEEAFTVGRLLNQMGIRQVSGNLVVAGKFYMNFYEDPARSGELLKQGLNAQLWPAEAAAQFRTLPAGTLPPHVQILGSVQVVPAPPDTLRQLLRHQSRPLAELLKAMNLYSNNLMADMLANAVGGAAVVAQKAIAATGIPASEIRLQNGSGLGEENQLSARAACALFLAIENLLQPDQLSIADVFAVVGQDEGVLEKRLLPPLLITKSGTLNAVSTLAGALPTQQGIIWFAIMNGGTDLVGFRTEQGALLQRLANFWQPVRALPADLTPNPARQGQSSRTEPIP
jgi:D-alanyl-D-alanine carboxypeptidase/D-alanyl-D-alanine-endopeptidase (penicillin-binding protein 4)